jgi:HEAT repeats
MLPIHLLDDPEALSAKNSCSVPIHRAPHPHQLCPGPSYATIGNRASHITPAFVITASTLHSSDILRYGRQLGVTPRQHVEAACERLGKQAVISGCVDILLGHAIDDDFVIALVGPNALYVLGGREGGQRGYWPRVWAARALLYAWEDSAAPAIARAAADESWRVREMAAKVVARHRVDDAFTAITGLLDDPVPRVRAAAERAVRILIANQG